MKADIFNQLTQRLPQLDIKSLPNMPTSGFKRGELAMVYATPPSNGKSMGYLSQLMEQNRKFAPNTVERWTTAVHLLRYMGYTVEWEDQSECPVVFWVNTEGNGDAEAKMIDGILNYDYLANGDKDITPKP